MRLFTLLCILLTTHATSVIELDDSFPDLVADGSWLVNFYAPWCGYCRRLAPIYEQLGATLATMIPTLKVARVDASKFGFIAKRYNVQGFPTIKYFGNGEVLTYEGERSLRALTVFASRAHGPAVKVIQNAAQLSGNVSLFEPDPYFVLTDQEPCPLKALFFETAERLRLFSWFLLVPVDLISSKLEKPDSLVCQTMVFKDDGVTFYPDDADIIEFARWMLLERHPRFPYFSAGTLLDFGENELAARSTIPELDEEPSHRLLVLFLVDPSRVSSEESKRFLDLARSFVKEHWNTWSSLYHFGWTDAVNTLNELSIQDLPNPTVLVFDSREQLVYLMSESSDAPLEPDAVSEFLSSVRQGEHKAHGGTGFRVRQWRLWRRLWSEIGVFATEHPMVTLIVSAVPTMLLSGLCYLCFCLDENYGDTVEDHPSQRRPPTSDQREKSTRRHGVVTGPLESKDDVDARHELYEEWKKTR